MKKAIILFIFLIGFGFASIAQDIIFKKNGDEIYSRVVKISDTEIEYRRFDQGDTGPIYSIKKMDVLLIKYENGTKDIFNNTPIASPPTNPAPPSNPANESPVAIETSDPNEESMMFSIGGSFGSHGLFGLDARLGYKKWGFYFSLRGNSAFFGNNGPFYKLQYKDYMVNTNNFYVNDYKWTGNSAYRRGSTMIGAQYRLAKWRKQDGLHLFAGFGSGMAQYIYEFDISNVPNYEWAIDETKSRKGLDLEFGLFLNSGYSSLTLGYCILPDAYESGYVVFGAGLAFGSK